ncbi:odorant receptor Or2-like isoform X2 [Harpegnathos saltator]|uniref:odorant receptor Or2-like isoform X2 n=1 Tax=Harpegnathos saltator TaxID=610380 RepID=UPI0009490388|nr:odorant receptor Or2-like isoform X2 [Harpegnathos saltator]
MEFLGYQYYRLIRIFLSWISLWPYQQTLLKQIQAIVCIIVLVSSIVTQLLKLFTMEHDLNLILTDLAFAIPSVIYLLKYKTFYIKSREIRKLMERVRRDWNTLKDEQELEIIKKCAESGRIYLYTFAGIIYPGTVLFILWTLLPDILDAVAPLNETRPRQLPFMAEYFLDQQKYFHPILLHMQLTAVVGIVTVVSTETLFFAYVHHVCGLFDVASYRIEHALDESVTVLSASSKINATHMKIIGAVDIHQRAIEFFQYLMSTFSSSYFILIILGVASLSLNLFRLFQIILIPGQRESSVPYVIFVSGHFYYMFICNYMGQKVMDYSTGVSKKTYSTQWYAAPVQTQKLLLFVMQRSMKSCKLIIGGIYPASVEDFTTLASMSLSYFTVIYSVQQ